MSSWVYYNYGASRGNAYYVPHTVQATLTQLLKKLPTAVRPIYREYYGDIIASRVRAKDSAVAMAKFVDTDFPAISRLHNRLANLMNPEIEKQKAGDEAVKFPVVGDGTAAGDDDEDVKDGQLAQLQKRNAAKARQIESGKKVVAPEDMLATGPETALETDLEPEMREESPTLAYPPTTTDTEVVEPAANQSPGTSPASPTIPDSEHDPDNDMDPELLDAPVSWDDSLWPHGDWFDSIASIEGLPWARPRSP